MSKVILFDVYGWGGWHLDPARGQAQIVRRIREEGVETVGPFDPGDGSMPEVAKKAAAGGASMMYCGDSCGANRFSWLQGWTPGIKWAYAALIQPSLYCNAGCPPIAASAKQVDVFYTSFLTFPLPGLGCFKPQPVNTLDRNGMAQSFKYPGSYLVNNGRTTLNYIDQRLHVHPGDDDAGTQSIILKQAQALLAAR